MQQDISSKQMYKLVNEALSECYNFRDYEVNQNIKRFQKQHWEQIKKDPQLNIFADEIPTKQEVCSAVFFCDLLDEYRKSVDVYVDFPEPLTEYSKRKLLECVEYYRPYITEDNKSILNVLEKSVKKSLPEYKREIALEEYSNEAKNIAKYRKEYVNAKKSQKDKQQKYYESLAVSFFETLKNDQEISNYPSSPQKLSTYSNILNIVDCLPSEKYTRTYKYKLKINLNKAIVKMCKDLGPQYYMAGQKAKIDIEKYENAIENARIHRKGRRLTDDEIARMNQRNRH